MVKRATKESVERSSAGPDYASALMLIEGKLVEAKTAQGQASKKASEVWTAVEKLGVNKIGAQIFNRIYTIEDDAELDDVLRTLSKMLAEANIRIVRDLADDPSSPAPEIIPTRVDDGIMSAEVYKEEVVGKASGEAPTPTGDVEPKKAARKAAGSTAGENKPPRLSIVTPDATD